MDTYRKGFVSVDSDDQRKWFPAEILADHGTPESRVARFDRETTERICEQSNQTYANSGFNDRLTMNPDGTVTVNVDGTTTTVVPDDDGMYAVNPWGWEEVILVTMVATFVIPAQTTGPITEAVKVVLGDHQAKLIDPCGWAPDPDTIAECLDGMPFGLVNVADLN